MRCKTHSHLLFHRGTRSWNRPQEACTQQKNVDLWVLNGKNSQSSQVKCSWLHETEDSVRSWVGVWSRTHCNLTDSADQSRYPLGSETTRSKPNQAVQPEAALNVPVFKKVYFSDVLFLFAVCPNLVVFNTCTVVVLFARFECTGLLKDSYHCLQCTCMQCITPKIKSKTQGCILANYPLGNAGCQGLVPSF